jgi:hypothetical protein
MRAEVQMNQDFSMKYAAIKENITCVKKKKKLSL